MSDIPDIQLAEPFPNPHNPCLDAVGMPRFWTSLYGRSACVGLMGKNDYFIEDMERDGRKLMGVYAGTLFVVDALPPSFRTSRARSDLLSRGFNHVAWYTSNRNNGFTCQHLGLDDALRL